MKKAKMFLLACMTACLALSVACSSDNDEDGIDKPNSAVDDEVVPPVPEELKPFVGLWTILSDKPGWENPMRDGLFCSDGHYWEFEATVREGSNNYHWSKSSLVCDWTYDSQTKILALIGESRAQWQITAMGDGEWSGLSLWDSQKQVGYTAKKDTTGASIGEEIFYFNSEWHGEEDWITAESQSAWGAFSMDLQLVQQDTAIYFQGGQAGRHQHQELDILFGTYYDEAADKLVLYGDDNHWGYARQWICRQVTIEIVHPYSYDHMYMNCYYDGKLVSAKLLPKWRWGELKQHQNDKLLQGTWVDRRYNDSYRVISEEKLIFNGNKLTIFSHDGQETTYTFTGHHGTLTYTDAKGKKIKKSYSYNHNLDFLRLEIRSGNDYKYYQRPEHYQDS